MKQFLRYGRFAGVICLLGFGLSVRPALAKDPVTGGVEAGVDINKPSLDITGLTASTSVRAGALAGFFVQDPITDLLAVQMEFAYEQKGFGVSFSDGTNTQKSTVNVDFAEIPVLARLNLKHSAGHLGYYVIVGPALGFRTRTNQTDTTSNGVSQPDKNVLKSQLQRIDVSIIGGAGITKGKWDIEGRYDAGVRNLNLDNKLGVGTDIRSRTTSIVFRWRFK